MLIEVGEGGALVIDILPVDVSWVGRDIDALRSIALHELLDREAEGSGGEECGGDILDRMSLLDTTDLGSCVSRAERREFCIGGAKDAEKSLRVVRGTGSHGRSRICQERTGVTSTWSSGYFRFLQVFHKRGATVPEVRFYREPS